MNHAAAYERDSIIPVCAAREPHAGGGHGAGAMPAQAQKAGMRIDAPCGGAPSLSFDRDIPKA